MHAAVGQSLDHVVGFMKLATLDRCVGAEGATDDFAQRLGAVDDEQPADLGIKPGLDQIVDERLRGIKLRSSKRRWPAKVWSFRANALKGTWLFRPCPYSITTEMNLIIPK
jgi:hypothetical protein